MIRTPYPSPLTPYGNIYPMNTPAKILVVDDTPRNVKLLADLLGVKGYEVVTAASGQEALAKIDAEPPDLVLLDVVMPEMSGYEVCHADSRETGDGNAAGGDGDGARSVPGAGEGHRSRRG